MWISFAHAAAPAPTGFDFASILPFIGIFILFYFMIIRPQQKRLKDQEKLVNSLQKGDKVVTNGGIYGQIVGIEDTILTIEIANNVHIKMQRAAVQTVLPNLNLTK